MLQEDLRRLLEHGGLPPASGLRGAATAAAAIGLNAGAYAVVLHRAAARLERGGHGTLAWALTLLNTLLTGADIAPGAQFGPGLMIHHPVGVVVHAGARVGARARLHSGVVIGMRGGAGDPGDAAPVIGDDVVLGTGAKLLGPIRVGDGAWIGANAVVTRDVPAHRTAVGVPARTLPVAAAPTAAHSAGPAGSPGP